MTVRCLTVLEMAVTVAVVRSNILDTMFLDMQITTERILYATKNTQT